MAVASSSSSLALDIQCCNGLRRGDSINGVSLLALKSRLLVRERGVKAALAAAPHPTSKLEGLSFKQSRRVLPSVRRMKEDEKKEIREPVTHEKLDRWMNESIGQIVSKIGEAPFLVRIFSDEDSQCELRLETEAASTEQWEGIKKRWEQEIRTPDAIVLVDELSNDDDSDHRTGETCSAEARTPRRTWGMAVQGRGTDCASCYILNTCRVKSSVGFCTHFCLARAKCFGEPWELQLRNAWLQGR